MGMRYGVSLIWWMHAYAIWCLSHMVDACIWCVVSPMVDACIWCVSPMVDACIWCVVSPMDACMHMVCRLSYGCMHAYGVSSLIWMHACIWCVVSPMDACMHTVCRLSYGCSRHGGSMQLRVCPPPGHLPRPTLLLCLWAVVLVVRGDWCGGDWSVAV